MFHHHNDDKVSFQKASACEKVVFYGYKNGICKHKNHFSRQLERCALCDHHNTSVHTVSTSFFSSFKEKTSFKHNIQGVNYIFTSTSETSDRGPPFI